MEKSIDIPLLFTSLLFSEKTATTSNKICPGGESECMDTETCCKLAGGGYGCCPLKHAVCCKDGEHCCPQGYICSEGEMGFSMVEIHELPKISDCNISDIKVEKLSPAQSVKVRSDKFLTF